MGRHSGVGYIPAYRGRGCVLALSPGATPSHIDTLVARVYAFGYVRFNLINAQDERL